jgi:hypothetical protein
VDDGVTWQVHSTRWQEKEGVTLLYCGVERAKLRLQSEEDELEDAEYLLSDDEDVERSSPEEVRKWVDDYAAAEAAASQLTQAGVARGGGAGSRRRRLCRRCPPRGGARAATSVCFGPIQQYRARWRLVDLNCFSMARVTSD